MKIAVKVPFEYLNPDVVIAEAKKQYKLRNSTRIVRIQSFGKQGRLRYIVMEYCQSSLETMLKGVFSKSKHLSYEEAARIIGQVCEGIKFAHNVQDPEGPFVHGDIKPVTFCLMKTTRPNSVILERQGVSARVTPLCVAHPIGWHQKFSEVRSLQKNRTISPWGSLPTQC